LFSEAELQLPVQHHLPALLPHASSDQQAFFRRAVAGDELALAALLNAQLTERGREDGMGGVIGQHLLGLDLVATDGSLTDGERSFAEVSRLLIRMLMARCNALATQSQ
jgi:hypothetical protein